MQSVVLVISIISPIFWHLVTCEDLWSLKSPYNEVAQPKLNCTFENTYCSWKEISTSIKWKIRQGNAYDESSGPSRDHTTGGGAYLVVKADHAPESGAVLLESPLIATPNGTCFSFWYMMRGYDAGSLTVSRTVLGDVRSELFSMFGPQGNRWYHAVVDAGFGRYKLQIEATYERNGGNGYIAVDDVTFSYAGPCQQYELTKDTPRFDCDFEEDLCSWISSTGSYRDTKMVWHRKVVPSDSTERNALHPYSNGTSYAELNSDSYTGYSYYTMTWLQGPTVSVDSKNACISFWYKMEGEMVSSFKLQKFNYGKELKPYGNSLWSIYDKGDQSWKHVYVDVPEGDYFYMAFCSEIHLKKKGKLSLDDIRLLYGGPCPKESKESLVNCDFENHLCQWYMKTKKNEGDWIRATGPTPTNNTGPSRDHTTGDGHYIYLDALKVEKATIFSPSFRLDEEGACLSFWYYMHGEDVYLLILELYTHGYRSRTPQMIWLMDGDRDDRWIQQNVSISYSGTGLIHLSFEARRGLFPRGDIAIDDISISFDGHCESDIVIETTTVAPETNITSSVKESTSTSTTTTTTTTTTPTPQLPRPTVVVSKGKIDPAYVESHVELICHADVNVSIWIGWYRKERHGYGSPDRLRDETSRKLVFDEIHPQDAGTYFCRINRYDYVSSEMSNALHIKVVPDPRPKPELLLETQRGSGLLVQQVDSVIKLVCGPRDVDGAVYHWRTTSYFGRRFLPNSRELIFNKTAPKHSGTYSCQMSKDGYFTAKSNEVQLNVKPGKECSYDYQCRGKGYYKLCKEERCWCTKDAILKGRECRLRPTKPTIRTVPNFLEFGSGESFYLVCEVETAFPSSMTYRFERNRQQIHKENEHESLNVIKITNTTERDSGFYTCKTSFQDTTSEESTSIEVEIKKFVNLSCDFEEDMCQWSHVVGPNKANFTITESSTSDEEEREGAPSGKYLQLLNGDKISKSSLRSPLIGRTTRDSCLKFWYRMHGLDVYSLAVYKNTFNSYWDEDTSKLLWNIIGDQSEDWLLQKINIAKDNDFYIVFEAIGHVEIDSISFSYREGC